MSDPARHDLVEALKVAFEGGFITAESGWQGDNCIVVRFPSLPKMQAAHSAFLAALASEAAFQVPADGWQDIASAPKDLTPVIVAVPNREQTGHIVGEAFFDPEHYEGGDWWWAGTHYSDYHSSPISDSNHHAPSRWRPLPAAPDQEGPADGK